MKRERGFNEKRNVQIVHSFLHEGERNQKYEKYLQVNRRKKM